MAMRQLAALSTGYNGKNNVFIPNINDFKAKSLQQVVVFVPGIAATVERRPDDTLIITNLTLSAEYESIQRGSRQKPGVYNVRISGADIKVQYKNNGRITAKDMMKVAIVDTSYVDPEHAAKEIYQKRKVMFGKNSQKDFTFNLFFSPLGSKLKGMKNYSPAVITKTYGYAGLLADAIEQTKNNKGIEWVSEQSGSVVLTQALMTLTEKNISFLDKGHIVNMCWATSNYKPTREAEIKLGMEVGEDIHKSNSNFVADVTAKMAGIARARDKNDPYTLSDYGKELTNGTFKLAATLGSISGVGALFVSGGAVGPSLAYAGAVAAVFGTGEVVMNVVKARLEKK